ncbi:MAG: hypothetical protein MHM6MM_006453 [Cercozoa sp. M6MM]
MSALKNIFSKNKTFKPIKGHQGSKRQQLHQYAKATLGSGNVAVAVQLPKGEDLNEWLAVNALDFFNEISLLYGTVSEFCTPTSCPIMQAGSAQYLWADGVRVKKPIECSAPDYIEYVMTWTEEQLNDEVMFPLNPGTPFPRNFQAQVKKIFTRLFRIYAHIYHNHFQQIVGLGAEAHLNTCFKHFIFFVNEFKLIETRELAPLQDLIDSFLQSAQS